MALGALGRLAGPWLAEARATLEAALGVRVRPGSGAPGRSSRRRWAPLVAPAAPDREVWWAPHRVRSGRVGAIALLAAASVGVLVLLAGLVADTTAGSRDAARLAGTLTVVGAAGVAVAAMLAIPVLRDIRRREVVALRNVTGETLVVPKALPLAAGLVALPIAFAAALGLSSTDNPSCAVFGARCFDLVVPADRAADDPRGPTMTVRFTQFPSSRDDARLLVIAIGGPGASGVAEAEVRIGELDPRIRRAFDVVYFDPRGVGGSGSRDCPTAADAWDQAVSDDPDAARAFVDACLREAGVATDDVVRYTTAQVVGDLDTLREHLGYERMALLGESYGTEVVQAYGMAHPERVEALILDAPVDLALSAHEFWQQAVDGFSGVLRATLEACGSEALCASTESPEALYERVVERLEDEPVVVSVPDGEGGAVEQRVTLETFQALVGSAMYDPAGRGLVARALVEADRGELGYLGRLAGDKAVVWDEDSISSFVYHAATCGDEPFLPPGGVDEYRRQAAAAGAGEKPLGSIYYAGLPCLFWPRAATVDSPGLSNAPFPVLALTATLDPITRSGAARALASRQPRGYVVETSAGGHGSFGLGDACVDDIVVALLVEGVMPEAAVTRCVGDVADFGLGLTPLDADEYVDAFDALASIDTELWAAPELYWWDGLDSVTFGCRAGGGTRLAWDGSVVRVTMFDCAWAEGLALDGNGTLDMDTGETQLRVVGTAIDVTYHNGVDGWSIAGEWRGEEIAEEG